MIGGGISSASRSLIRLATTGIMLSGAGLAGYSYYEGQQLVPGVDPSFIQRHAPLFIGIGVAGLVLGAVVQFVSMRRMQKRMMQQMGGMMGGMGGGMGGMPDFSKMGTPQPKEVVRVRCAHCKALNAEDADYCSKCGKPMKA